MKALKILFADDDLKYSMLLKRFLEKEGYEVTYAGNGKIALEQFPLIKPDLVLLDINMPGYNGFEVAERIREMDKHVLIFFLSDRSDKADRLQGFQLKANDYLAKPFYPEELTARIRERFTSQLSGVAEDEMYAFGHSVFNYSTNEIRTGNSKVLITSRLYFRNTGSLTDARDFQSSSSAPFTVHSPLAPVSFFMATTARQASFMER